MNARRASRDRKIPASANAPAKPQGKAERERGARLPQGSTVSRPPRLSQPPQGVRGQAHCTVCANVTPAASSARTRTRAPQGASARARARKRRAATSRAIDCKHRKVQATESTRDRRRRLRERVTATEHVGISPSAKAEGEVETSSTAIDREHREVRASESAADVGAARRVSTSQSDRTMPQGIRRKRATCELRADAQAAHAITERCAREQQARIRDR
jgi:hypothetical protein